MLNYCHIPKLDLEDDCPHCEGKGFFATTSYTITTYNERNRMVYNTTAPGDFGFCHYPKGRELSSRKKHISERWRYAKSWWFFGIKDLRADEDDKQDGGEIW